MPHIDWWKRCGDATVGIPYKLIALTEVVAGQPEQYPLGPNHKSVKFHPSSPQGALLVRITDGTVSRGSRWLRGQQAVGDQLQDDALIWYKQFEKIDVKGRTYSLRFLERNDNDAPCDLGKERWDWLRFSLYHDAQSEPVIDFVY